MQWLYYKTLICAFGLLIAGASIGVTSDNPLEPNKPSAFGVGSMPVAQKFNAQEVSEVTDQKAKPSIPISGLRPPQVPPQAIQLPENAVPEPPLIIQKEENSSTAIVSIGDLLSITIKEDRTGPQMLLVDEQGIVMLPYIGGVKAVGLSHKALSELIKQKLEATFYKQATVIVATASQDGTRGQIQVTGQVNRPGTIPLPTDSILTASGAIVRAGGNTALADLTRVTIIRRDMKNTANDTRISVNVSDVINNGRFDQDVPVKANDIVLVPVQGESVGRVLISGAIRNEGSLNIPIGEKYTLTKAIPAAGGFAEFADQTKVKIIRKDPDSKNGQKIIIVNYQDIMEKGALQFDEELKNDDIIHIPEKWLNL